MLSHTTNFTAARNLSRTASVTATPATPRALSGTFEMMGAPMSYSRNAEIYGENDPAEYLYKLVSGTVRTSKILHDGRRQIGAFYLPGDLFGHEFDSAHSFAAEAITDVKVIVVKRSAIEALAARDNDAARQLWAMTGRELQRVQDHIMLLIKSAQERVAGFLLEMSARIDSSDEVELPMSRLDIADYLGLTIETVSRTLTSLEGSKAIELPSSRHIVLRNRAALRRLNS